MLLKKRMNEQTTLKPDSKGEMNRREKERGIFNVNEVFELNNKL